MITKLMQSILPFGNPIETKVFILNDVRDDILTTLYKKSYGNKKGYEIFLEHVSLLDKTHLQYNYRTFQPYVDVLMENRIKIDKTYVYPELKLYTEYNFFEDYEDAFNYNDGYAIVNINYNKIYVDILSKIFNDDLYINDLLLYKNIYKRVKEIEHHESKKQNETVDDILEARKFYNPLYF